MNERNALGCLWDTLQDRDDPCQDGKVQARGLSLHTCIRELGEGNMNQEQGTRGTAVQGSTHIQRHAHIRSTWGLVDRREAELDLEDTGDP